MTFLRPALSLAGIATILVAVTSGCSERSSDDSSAKPENAPSVTTIDLTLDSQPVDLAGTAVKCYDYQGHLMVEAYDKADQDSTHFLMDYYNKEVALSIGIKGGQPDLYEYTPGKQSATVTRDDHSVSVAGTIGVALDDTTPPKPFSIKADCAEFVNTPPDSSSVG
jgi:hypothetical protein